MWECKDEVARSCSMTAGPFNPRFLDNKPRFRNSFTTKADMYATLLGERTDHWRSLIRIYTTQKLTYADNKLPALAGLAAAFHVSGCIPLRLFVKQMFLE
jgi:hypothetical protein